MEVPQEKAFAGAAAAVAAAAGDVAAAVAAAAAAGVDDASRVLQLPESLRSRQRGSSRRGID